MSENLSPRSQELLKKHIQTTEPSPWVSRFTQLVKQGGLVLDLAAGGGRHGRYFINQGYQAIFIDRQTNALNDLKDEKNATIISTNLEDGSDPFDIGGPLYAKAFDAIVVVNYLYRPLMVNLINALAVNGVLLYETFARGNEHYAKPRNPDHLLKNGELLDLVSGKLQIIAYEHGREDLTEIPGVKQRICAINDLHLSNRSDGDPAAHFLFP